jgi:hypothetical protein
MVATHFNSVLENVAPSDGNDVLEKKLAEKKKSALLQNIDVSLLTELTRHLLQYQKQSCKLSTSDSPSIQLVYPAYVASVKACQPKDGDSPAFISFKYHWAEAIELKWKPKIANIHMIGFFLDPAMKHLPACSDAQKSKIFEDTRYFCEIIKIEEGLDNFPQTVSQASTASEDSTPGTFSRRRARVIDLDSSDLFEDIIDDMR